MHDARARAHSRAKTHTKVRNEATKVEQNGIEKIKVEGEVEVKRNCKWEDGRNGEKETRGEYGGGGREIRKMGRWNDRSREEGRGG